MKKAIAVLATCFAVLASPAHATTTFAFIFDGGYPLAVSNDGSVVAGQLVSTGGVFRWTQLSGVVPLGRNQHLGAGGTVGISANGLVIASSIGSPDSSYTTQGRWTQATGWQELMPPTPPDGGLSDGSYGNIWSLSGDGTTPVGLYWRPGQGNRAHASKWTQATGVVDLGGTTTGQASRANGVNYDGSVIAGWVETPTGPWRPAAWVNGSLVLLTDYDESGGIPAGSGEARATSPSGDIVVGYARDEASNQRAAAMWVRSDGVFGPTQILGWVDGSEPANGINIAQAVSASGKIAVGYCSFDGSPFSTTGFVWTPSDGVIDVNQWLGDHGVLVDPNFTIQSLTAMTPDGTQIFGHGQMLTSPYARRAFRITTTDVAAAPPTAAVVRLELSAPSPNPSRLAQRVEYALPAATSIDLSIYDASGRRIATLVHGDVPEGRRSVVWNGRESNGRTVTPGLYFARLQTPQGSAACRLVRID
jgi:uncharacterized membrane protein